MTLPTPLRIATRTSQLALWQANHVRDTLLKHYPETDPEAITLVEIKSDGDRDQSTPLPSFGYKGVFTQRIEQALINGRADIAVHSMKDVPTALADGMAIVATLEREDPRDAFISNRYDSLDAMPEGTTIGTASTRRSAMLTHLRPDLNIVPFRGNVPTRLRKLDDGEVDATLLAAAGLKRLNLSERITDYFSFAAMLPAATQGIVAIECDASNNALVGALKQLSHDATFQAASAERAVLDVIDGDCHTAIGVYAAIDGEQLTLQSQWFTDGRILFANATGLANEAIAVGKQLGEELLAQQRVLL